MTNYYTVIIPTMWQSPDCIARMLKIYCNSEYVREVIVVDNDISKTIHGSILGHNKIRVITNNRNLYVNPAWNWGVSQSTTEKIIIANDDIVIKSFDRLISNIDEFLKPNQIIGPCKSCFNKSDSELYIERSNERNYGWGVFMVLYRESYTQIPNELLIWCGDNIQHSSNDSYKFKGINIQSKMSTTINNKKVLPMAQNDLYKFNDYYNDNGELINFNGNS